MLIVENYTLIILCQLFIKMQKISPQNVTCFHSRFCYHLGCKIFLTKRKYLSILSQFYFYVNFSKKFFECFLKKKIYTLILTLNWKKYFIESSHVCYLSPLLLKNVSLVWWFNLKKKLKIVHFFLGPTKKWSWCYKYADKAFIKHL